MALGFTALVGGGLLLLRKERVTLPWLPLACLLLTTAWSVVSLGQAVAWSTGVEPLLLLLVLTATFAIAHLQLKTFPSTQKWLSRCIGVSVLMLCIWGWVQMGMGTKGPNMPPFANQGNRNFLAEALLMMIPFSLLGMVSGSKRERWLHMLPAAAAVLLMTQAGSRGVLLGLVAATFVLWPLLSLAGTRRSWFLKPWLAVPFTLLLVAGGCISLWRYLPQPEKTALTADPVPRIEPSMTSAEERFILWRHAVEEANAHPLLGVGIGQWKLVAGRSGIRGFHQGFATRFYTSTHNDYVQVAAETGWLGLLLFLSLPLATFLVGIRGLRKTTSWRDALLLAIPLAGICGYAVAGFFGFPKERPLTAGLHLILCAMVWSRVNNKVFRLPTWLIAVVAVLAGGMALLYGNLWLKSDGHAVRMEKARQTQQWERVKQEAQLAESSWTQHEDASATPFAWHIGIAWFQQGRLDMAVPEMRRARALSPWHPQVLNAFGSATGMAGDLAASEEAYREALRLFPDWEEVALNLSTVLVAQGKREEASRMLRETYQGVQSTQIKEALEKIELSPAS